VKESAVLVGQKEENCPYCRVAIKGFIGLHAKATKALKQASHVVPPQPQAAAPQAAAPLAKAPPR